ncbi:hypothetical protein ACIGHG_24380 [Bacillus sp. NPDC077411]|uniref:hypothetical protein n=1 Tax=Bacillus sp. NPDC077411 TaxID=3363947 RepID=UPI0037CA03A7
MKLVHLYNKETGAYIGDEIIFPRQEEYQEEGVTVYQKVYEIPKNSTEVLLPQPNWKPVFKDGSWIETITQDELDEINKPPVLRVTELKKIQDKVEFLADQVADMRLE